MNKNIVVVRSATISMSLKYLLKGQLKYLNKYYSTVGISSGDDLNDVSKREGVPVLYVPMVRHINLTKDLIAVIYLIKIFMIIKPKIVHSITPKAGLLCMMAAYIARVPVRLHTFTGLVFPSKNGLLKKVLIYSDKLICHFATAVYPEGYGVRSDLIINNITTKPLKVLHNGNVNGVDTSYFSPKHFSNKKIHELKKRYRIPPNSFVFIFVGRLVGDKGVNELVQEFSSLQQKYPHIRLLLVGNYEVLLDRLQPESYRIIKRLDSIIETGWQEDVRQYMSISNVLILPSYREGFPNVPIQAGAMGLPSIVTDINGCNEIIVDGKNGSIIPPKNADALRATMENYILNPGLQKKLAKNAREMIVSRFEQKVVWEAIKGEYEYWLEKKDYHRIIKYY